MENYKIQIKLVSEAIFGSGHSIPGSVDLEIVYDDLGLPFMKAKTFKGNFRESMEEIGYLMKETIDKDMISGLLGRENDGVGQWRNLRFSDMRLSKNIRLTLRSAIDNGKLDKEEVKESLTDIRSFTSIDEDGSSAIGSLRQIRVIKKDLIFEVDLYSERDLSAEELGLLAMASRNLRHMGSMRTRGKGEVDCSLLVDENGIYKDVTDYYIDNFFKVVKANG